jgi:transcriptional regulator with XRE-family HTH domain
VSAERDANLFGRNLCLVRRRRGQSQEQLAARAGLSRDTIHKLEGGKRFPRLATVLTLADTLGVDPCELLEGLRPRHR